MSCMEPDLKRKKMNKSEKTLQESPGMTNIPTAEELREICRSPDPFADSPTSNNTSSEAGEIKTKISGQVPKESNECKSQTNCSDARNSSAKVECGGGESSKVNQVTDPISWKGSPLTDIQKGRSHGIPQMHPIKPSSTHTVMFQIGPVKKESTIDAWDNDHVRLPCSPQNKYPVGDTVKSRWDMVKAALEKPIKSSQELEEVIMSYNNKYLGRWDFSGLHYFFNEVIEEEESKCFFNELLPQIAKLTLQLPALITRPLPLLRQHQTHSISLTQQQVACLLANAFFCTFPRRNAARKASEYSSFPDINFNRLFQGQKKKSVLQRISEKLKCIFHYFRRVCCSPPKGTITFTRRYIAQGSCPAWDCSGHFFRKLHISSNGTIESCGKGMLQMDFANKMIGGGVLGWGCVQEEIRFVICPELIVARLFTECLDVTEALIITGCEQYSVYEGYADNFSWNGDYQDPTPRDASGRMLSNVVAIDALYLRYPAQQFIVNNLLREINKAYTGFFNSELNPENLCAIATGNWGCGVYHGNARLKALLQLMAASQAGRALAYFTFGDSQLRDDVYKMHKFLVNHRATVGLVWRHLSKYYDQCYRSGTFNTELYDFLYKSIDPTKRSSPMKGRPTAVQSTLKMKTSSTQNEKSKHPKSPHSKGNLHKSGNVSCTAIQNKRTISRSTTSRCGTSFSDQMRSTNTRIGKAHSCSLPVKKVRPGLTRSVSVLKPQSSSKGESRNPSKVSNITLTNKAKAPLDQVNKLWERRSMSPQPRIRNFLMQTRSPSSPENISPTRSSPVMSRSFNPPKSNRSPKSSLNTVYGIDDVANEGEGIGGSEKNEDIDNELYRRPHCLTIQKRISDYFYEINVPK